ncbi:MAG: hypothetical protein K1X94_05615, partial [Sandaracinaceae bacterium]|nr:hypothetical protein [Sandaracinaceae bacterium]
MNDELMRKISDAIDSEDGLAGDPELVQLLATSPEAARYAKHLSRMQRWLAAWPIRDPSEAELEGLAANIDARLGEKFSGDYTRAPDFEEDEELASVTSGLLQPGDLEADASSSFDLTMSAITELADHVNEQASAQPVARVPLRKGAVPPPRGALAPTTDDDDLPAALPKAKLPKVPAPRAGATTVLGNPTATAKASDDVAESPAAPKKSDEAHAAHHEPPTPPPAAKKSDEAHAAHHEPPPPPPAAKKSDEAHGAHHGPPPPPPASKKGEHEPPPPPPAAKKDAKKGDPKKPDAKKPTKPEAKAPELEDRVSIPIPLTQGPRLELLEGGKSKAPPPREEAKRSWLPAILAAAAIGIGVIGVGSLTMNGAAPTSVQPASAVGGVSPAATQSTPVVSPTQSPSQDEVGLGQGMAEAAVAEPAPPPAVAPAAPVTPGGADPSAVAPTTAASSTTGLMGGGGASRGQPEASRVSAEGSDWGPQGGPARRAAPRGAAAHSDGEGRGGGGDTPSTGASRGSIDDSVSGGGGTGGRT